MTVPMLYSKKYICYFVSNYFSINILTMESGDHNSNQRSKHLDLIKIQHATVLKNLQLTSRALQSLER